MKDIIWDGSEQIFTDEQLSTVNRILDGMPKTGRYVKRYHQIVQLFVPEFDTLFEASYIVHHIDGDCTHDHPWNLMVISQSAHRTLHWSQKSVEDRIAHGNAISKGRMVPEVREANSKVMQKVWRDLSPKKRQEWSDNIRKSRTTEVCNAISRTQGGAGIRADKFLRNQIEPFTSGDFNDIAGFAMIKTAGKCLIAYRKAGEVELIGWNGRSNIYRSLICEAET